MNSRTLVLALFITLLPSVALAGPWSLGAETGPMLWLFKDAPLSYAMTLTPGYEVMDDLILEAAVGLRQYSSETEDTENTAFAVPVMVGGRYLLEFGQSGVAFVSGLHVGGYVLVEDDRGHGMARHEVGFEPGGRVFIGGDFQILEGFSLSLTTALEVTPNNLFATAGLGGRVRF